MPEDKFVFERERSFVIDLVSEVDGERYQGRFLARRLMIGDLSKISAIKTALGGGRAVTDPAYDFINEMIATCEVAVDGRSAPKWWQPRELYDPAILEAVYKEVQAFNSFREWKATREREAAGSGADGGASANAGAAPDPGSVLGSGSPKVVDFQVPASGNKR